MDKKQTHNVAIGHLILNSNSIHISTASIDAAGPPPLGDTRHKRAM